MWIILIKQAAVFQGILAAFLWYYCKIPPRQQPFSLPVSSLGKS